MTASSAVSAWWNGASTDNVWIDCNEYTLAHPQICNEACVKYAFDN
jgi:hypothetical protein